MTCSPWEPSCESRWSAGGQVAQPCDVKSSTTTGALAAAGGPLATAGGPLEVAGEPPAAASGPLTPPGGSAPVAGGPLAAARQMPPRQVPASASAATAAAWEGSQ